MLRGIVVTLGIAATACKGGGERKAPREVDAGFASVDPVELVGALDALASDRSALVGLARLVADACGAPCACLAAYAEAPDDVTRTHAATTCPAAAPAGDASIVAEDWRIAALAGRFLAAQLAAADPAARPKLAAALEALRAPLRPPVTIAGVTPPTGEHVMPLGPVGRYVAIDKAGARREAPMPRARFTSTGAVLDTSPLAAAPPPELPPGAFDALGDPDTAGIIGSSDDLAGRGFGETVGELDGWGELPLFEDRGAERWRVTGRSGETTDARDAVVIADREAPALAVVEAIAGLATGAVIGVVVDGRLAAHPRVFGRDAHAFGRLGRDGTARLRIDVGVTDVVLRSSAGVEVGRSTAFTLAAPADVAAVIAEARAKLYLGRESDAPAVIEVREGVTVQRLVTFLDGVAASGARTVVVIDHAPPVTGSDAVLSLGGVTLVDGKADVALVRRYLKRQSTKLTTCYLRQLARVPGLVGTVGLDLLIDNNGKVVFANADGVDAELHTCISDVIMRVPFPRFGDARDGVRVKATMTFRPPDGGAR